MKMKGMSLGHLRQARGTSLIEVMLGTLLVVAVVAALATLGPKLVKAIAQRGNRMVANTLASSQLEKIADVPYQNIALTPSDSFPPSSRCDCKQANWTAIPSTTVVSGQITYTQQVCVNLVSGPGGNSICPGSADTGLKNIVERVSWGTGAHAGSYEIQNVVNRKEELAQAVYNPGTFSIRTCEGPAIPDCSAGGTLPPIPHVSVYQGSILADNRGAGPTVRTYDIVVPPQTGYSIHVQADGYFPFHLDNRGVTPGATVQIEAPLLPISGYASKLGGEVFVSTHPVISKIVAQVSENTSGCTAAPIPSLDLYCPDYTEALEIYNPTSNTYTVGPGGNLKVQYCANACSRLPDNFTVSPFSLTTPISLPPGRHLLIVGKDLNSRTAWSTADIRYTVTGTGLIPSGSENGGGGIKLLVNEQVVDSVRWRGVDNAYPPDFPGPWTDSNPLPANSLKPATCTGGGSSCNCGIWGWSACGPAGGCPDGQRRQTRTCNPAGCDLEANPCQADPVCAPQSCTLSNPTPGACGAAGGCQDGQRRFTRTCDPPGCQPQPPDQCSPSALSYCQTDSSCVSQPPSCTLSGWTNGACGQAGNCPEGRRRHTRTCDPPGCQPQPPDQCNLLTECFQDASCAPQCTCPPWIDGACGAAEGCLDGQRHQTRASCTPDNCDGQGSSRCVADSSCVYVCLPGRDPIYGTPPCPATCFSGCLATPAGRGPCCNTPDPCGCAVCTVGCGP